MFNAFKFRHTQDTWKRPVHESPKNVDSKTIVNSLTADFQEKIKNKLLLEKHRLNMEDRLPLVDNVGVYITVCSREKYILPFVVKNVLDAMSGSNLAYNDDSKVISVYAEYVIGESDFIKIALYPETRFYQKSILNNAFIKFNVDAVPNDDIIQNPRTVKHKLIQNLQNTAYTGMIVQEMKRQGVTLLSDSDLYVYIDIHTANNTTDIDNYCLPYIFAMEGIVYSDIKNISHMYLNLYRNCAGRDMAKVEVCEAERA